MSGSTAYAATDQTCGITLGFQSPLLVSGTDKQAGAVYRYSNVDSGVDALVEVLDVSNATIGQFDATSSGALGAFQAELMQDQSAGASIPDQHVDYEIRFIDAYTDQPVTLGSFQATAVDVDGDDRGSREYSILYDADSYTLETPTDLTSSYLGHFTPVAVKNVNGISLTNKKAMVTARYTNVSSIRYTTGFSNDGSDYHSYHRLSSLSFECVIYDSPTVIPGANKYDYGDAPVTGLASDGTSPIGYAEARHKTVNGIFLGVIPGDSDSAYQPRTDANGDDADGNDDEDGIDFSTVTLKPGQPISLSINVTGTGGYLQGWIDFNGNGVFDSNEQVAKDLQDNGAVNDTTAGDGRIDFVFDVPITSLVAKTYSRFRWSTTLGLDSAATADDGEVEDYAVLIESDSYSISGRVYNDSNVNGLSDTNEVGVSGLPIVLRDVVNGTCLSTRTNANGHYLFENVVAGSYQVYEASRETVPTPQNCDVAQAKDPTGYRSTTDNVIAQFTVGTSDVTGKDFGDVKDPQFSPDNTKTVLPGNVVFYRHTFTPQSSGSVTFSQANTGGATSGWNSNTYLDANCDGEWQTSETTSALNTAMPTTEGTEICLINKVFVPSNVDAGESYTNTITADFDYGNVIAGTETLTVKDVTQAAAGNDSKLELVKTVENVSKGGTPTTTQNQAEPGDTLRYSITYRNTGTGPITDLKINDTAQAFTLLQATTASCNSTPTDLNCSPIENDPDVEWQFTGTLVGGAQGSVSYDVLVE